MTLKVIHIACVALSISGFILRGIWMMMDSPWLQSRWAKTLPHIIDTLLLLSAISMAVLWSYSPFEQQWLMVKIVMLVVYILLGSVALKRGPTKSVRVVAWLMAISVFAYIVRVAMTKSTGF